MCKGKKESKKSLEEEKRAEQTCLQLLFTCFYKMIIYQNLTTK